MPRGKKELRLSASTAAAADTSSSATDNPPELGELLPDGSFWLRTSSGQKIQGNCREPTFRLSPRPITYDQNPWYTDCDPDESPHTLRIYRFANDGSLVDLQLHSYVPETCTWISIKTKVQSNDSENDGRSESSSSPLGSILSRFFFLLRICICCLLWPLADFKWRNKMAWRLLYCRLVPIECHQLNDAGYIPLMGGPLSSVQLRKDGSVRVNDEVLRPGDFHSVKTDSIQWYGDMLFIERDDDHAVLTFELNNWREWRVARPNSRAVTVRQLDIIRRQGEKVLWTTISVGWKALAVIVFVWLITKVVIIPQIR